ncbi:hypothetical protein BBJ28_00005185 [Nothophytophthora sp. Chile5]|nr:hypothetical protein BBJ28_00005185 [Nothophytophthora sp. Chile5]
MDIPVCWIAINYFGKTDDLKPDRHSRTRATTMSMFMKRDGDESLKPKGNEDSAELHQMLTSCMINRQILVRAPVHI